MSWHIITTSGSEYVIRQDGERWYVQGVKQKATPTSKLLGDREWEITRPTPWPPELGFGVFFSSTLVHRLDHPDRMPGGGKLTADIRIVTQFILPTTEQGEADGEPASRGTD